VTGGNTGIGASVARALAAAGARVAVNHVVDPEAAAAVVADIRHLGGEAWAFEADVSDARQVAAMFEAVDRRWDGIDVLVNNAGVDGARAVAWEADPAEWLRVIRIDLLGPFHCAREALRRMVPRKSGVVLNLTSVHERIAWSGYSAYTAAKAGLSMMTKTLAQEAAPFGVRVVALAPGAVRTPINRAVWSDPAGLSDLVAKIPLGRMGEPEEIARVAAFLVSDAASYLTGSTVFVDGAMTDDPEFARGG
ncbi:MAG TPA: SDR family oxidoreductase, partial [Anaeromyxobacteraceae bacterium]|nr:SDR family oxidoreductase [Anaeromyxobacteraceae bacterium]